MSHFVVGIIMPNEILDTGDVSLINRHLKEVLDKYDENKAVPEYDHKCFCVGRKAKDEVSECVGREMGNVQQWRDRFHTWMMAELGYDDEKKYGAETNSFVGTNEENREIVHERWNRFIDERQMRETELFVVHKDKDKADPECTQCNGTGTYKSTYNPDSKWDWWVIGGRWCGWITSNEPLWWNGGADYEELSKHWGREKTDPQYALECRQQEVTNNRLSIDEWLVKLGYEDLTDSPRSRLAQYRAALEKGKDWASFAVVDPKGQWHQRGEMLMFGAVCDEVDKKDWHEAFIEIVSKYRGGKYSVLMLDVHI